MTNKLLFSLLAAAFFALPAHAQYKYVKLSAGLGLYNHHAIELGPRLGDVPTNRRPIQEDYFSQNALYLGFGSQKANGVLRELAVSGRAPRWVDRYLDLAPEGTGVVKAGRERVSEIALRAENGWALCAANKHGIRPYFSAFMEASRRSVEFQSNIEQVFSEKVSENRLRFGIASHAQINLSKRMFIDLNAAIGVMNLTVYEGELDNPSIPAADRDYLQTDLDMKLEMLLRFGLCYKLGA